MLDRYIWGDAERISQEAPVILLHADKREERLGGAANVAAELSQAIVRGTARVGIWRQLKKSGAMPFQTSAYLLPNRPELRERFQWLAQQVRDAGGEATLACVAEVEGLSREEIMRIAHRMKTEDGIEALVLAGTELPLLLRDAADQGIEFLDTTVIHVEAVVDELLR